MINLFLNLCVVILFAILTAAYGYCAYTAEVWGPPLIATVLQGSATGIFTLYTIREYLK